MGKLQGKPALPTLPAPVSVDSTARSSCQTLMCVFILAANMGIDLYFTSADFIIHHHLCAGIREGSGIASQRDKL